MTIAGSDSGGGAGIQADLKAFSRFNTHGTSVITALTAQNPHLVAAIYPIPVAHVVEQFRTVMAAIKVNAIKSGMLFSAEIIAAIAAELAAASDPVPLVVDPVMVASSGAVLLQEDAIDALVEKLIPLATVITPNLPEAEILAGVMLEQHDEAGALRLAVQLATDFGTAVLVKGGHCDAGKSSDILATGEAVFRITTPEVAAATTHGTGCMLSAAICANLALGREPHDAIVAAKAYVYHNLADCRRIGPKTYAMCPPRSNDQTVVGVVRLK